MTSWRLRVDPVACDAFGYCAELAPEVITLDEWGYPEPSPEPVPTALMELARRAVADCPRRALALVEVTPATGTGGAPTRRGTTATGSGFPGRGTRVRLASTRRER